MPYENGQAYYLTNLLKDSLMGPYPKSSDLVESETLPKNAIPDFIAGYINAMTGHLYETELEACYISHSGDTVLPLPTLENAV